MAAKSKTGFNFHRYRSSIQVLYLQISAHEGEILGELLESSNQKNKAAPGKIENCFQTLKIYLNCALRNPIVYHGRNEQIDERETEMMSVRWRVFEFTRKIPQADQKDLSPCGAHAVLANWCFWMNSFNFFHAANIVRLLSNKYIGNR